MGLHIGNSYRPATFDYMKEKSKKEAPKDTVRGLHIRRLRKALDWNQEEFADEISVDQSTVSDIENGAGFSADVLMRMSDKLGVSPTVIMRGQDRLTWPFRRLDVARFLQLDDTDRAVLEGVLIGELRRLEEGMEPTEEDVASLQAATKKLQRPAAKRKRSS